MKIAVLGVGLIGGSIGLAARGGWARRSRVRPGPGRSGRAVELGRDRPRRESVAEAVAGAEVVFCAAPVGALPELVAEALAAAARTRPSPTSARSRARGRSAARGRAALHRRPPAGRRRDSGVENARADLFEGARWYLTPTERTGGVLYDRLQRLVADLGARPQAIDAETHDRLMATVSHLPHVLANVLVGQAAAALGRARPSACPRSARASATRPGWRREPGDLGRHLRRQQRGRRRRGRRRRRAAARAAELLRSGDRDALGPGTARPGAIAATCSRPSSPAGRLCELRVLVPNSRGSSPRSRSPWAAPASTSRTWGSIRPPTCAPARSPCSWPARTKPSAPPSWSRELGHDASRVER